VTYPVGEDPNAQVQADIASAIQEALRANERRQREAAAALGPTPAGGSADVLTDTRGGQA